MEGKALLNALATGRSQAEHEVEFFRNAFTILEGDGAAASLLEKQLAEAEEFLAWVRGLEERVSIPFDTFDESRLSTAPADPKAEGYISLDEARVRLRVRKHS